MHYYAFLSQVQQLFVTKILLNQITSPLSLLKNRINNILYFPIFLLYNVLTISFFWYAPSGELYIRIPIFEKFQLDDSQKTIFRLLDKLPLAVTLKKSERKRKNLIRIGVDLDYAYQWSRSRKGGWAIAKSPILNTTITVAKLTQRGYESLLTHYYKVSPHYQSSPLFLIV